MMLLMDTREAIIFVSEASKLSAEAIIFRGQNFSNFYNTEPNTNIMSPCYLILSSLSPSSTSSCCEAVLARTGLG